MPSNLRKLLKKPGQKLTVTFGESVSIENPELRDLVLRIIHVDSWIETYRVIVFAEITKKDPTETMNRLADIVSISAKSKFIDEEIKKLLSGKTLALILAVFELADRCLNNRNRFAHSLFGHVKEFPNKLLVLAPKDFIRPNMTIKQKHANGSLTDKDGIERQDYFIEHALLYTKKEMETYVKEMDYVLSKLRYLDVVLQFPVFVRDLELQKLEAEPQIAAILKREETS